MLAEEGINAGRAGVDVHSFRDGGLRSVICGRDVICSGNSAEWFYLQITVLDARMVVLCALWELRAVPVYVKERKVGN